MNNIVRNLKRLAKALLPNTLRSQYHLDELYSAPVVRSGPFVGMKYGHESVGSSLTPKLIGSYEKELASAMTRTMAGNPRVVFDVGAAEGYYAVGFLTRIPDCKVYAFESTAEGRTLISRLARDNRVFDRIEILGHCTPELFREKCALFKPECIILDIEGGEGEFFSEELGELMRNTELFVEVHPGLMPEVDLLVKKRMQGTHTIREIRPEPRSFSDYWRRLSPLQKVFCGKTLVAYMGEGRGDISFWLHLIPRETRKLTPAIPERGRE